MAHAPCANNSNTVALSATEKSIELSSLAERGGRPGAAAALRRRRHHSHLVGVAAAAGPGLQLLGGILCRGGVSKLVQ